MRLHVIARGKIGRSPEAEMVGRYAKRIAWPFKLTELPDTGGTLPRPMSPHRDVLLDERGRQMTSEEFAALLGRWRDDGRPAASFVIGGPDGLSPDLTAAADLVLGLSPLTWPHQLVRIMLAEQLYRAVTILVGHPYHRQ